MDVSSFTYTAYIVGFLAIVFLLVWAVLGVLGEDR